MARRKNNATRFSRNYRRPPKWNMALPRRSRRRWRLADLRFYLSAAILIAVARPAGSGDGVCHIYQVIDGDTVRMWCQGRGNVPARLTGFDTPELFSPACPSELAAAMQAKWALRLAIWQAGKVTLHREGTDRYGRALVAAFLDGEPLARKMIADGHARPYSGGARQGWCA